MDDNSVENILYFVGKDLQDAVLRAEFVSSDPAAAFEYIENNRLETTYRVYRVLTRTDLGTGRAMKRNQSATEIEAIEKRYAEPRIAGPMITGRGAGRVGFGGGFCGGIGAGL